MDTINTSYILHHMHEDELPLNAVSPPVFQTSIFCFPNCKALGEAMQDDACHSFYSRGNNPTVNLAEEKIAALEGGERAKIVSSGMAAISHAVMAFVKAGDHVVCVEDCYGWTKTLLVSYLARFNVKVSFVEGTDTGEVIAALRPETRVLYLESPTSFTFKLQDLPAIAAEARKRNIKTIMDNTWATPIFCNPIKFGIDLVVHSASKYMSGASDIIAGAVIGSKDDIELIYRQEYLQLGPVPDPLMAWLMLRGLRTLHVRMKAHHEGALAVASFLEGHPGVERVFYPMLPSYTQITLARRLFSGASGLFSFKLRTKKPEEAIRFADTLRLFKRAVSWGGYESLVIPNAICYPNAADIPPDRVGLVRIHIGLERPEDLIADLEKALAAI
ncbi:MAG: aminotransferase class I/II-fold pyridoxal phosphate-dependent enzyme [Treponema sp.]|jgi:cystathionine beta-lyase|nr:aminotransferase class I/II-fold pyridoxal phosphate-dependent enzyme [Treponema sp.]